VIKGERGDVFYFVMQAIKEKVTLKHFEKHPWLLICFWEGFVLGFTYMTV